MEMGSSMGTQKVYLLCGIVVEGALHHHGLNFVLFSAIHPRNIVIHALRRRIRSGFLDGGLGNFPVFLVLIAKWDACDDETRILRNQIVIVFVLFLRLSIRYLCGEEKAAKAGENRFEGHLRENSPANRSLLSCPSASGAGWPSSGRTPRCADRRSPRS